MADPLSNQDVASKNYVDKNDFTTAGSVVSGDIKLNVGSDLIRSLGCNNITTPGDRHKYAVVFLA